MQDPIEKIHRLISYYDAEFQDAERRYQNELFRLKTQKELDLQNLSMEYVKQHAKYRVGDFIYNVTGIIKVDSIYGVYEDGRICIKYEGLRYKKRNDKLFRTKNNNTTVFDEILVRKLNIN